MAITPDPIRTRYGRVEITRLSDGKFLAFVGNAYGTRGFSAFLSPDELDEWLTESVENVKSGERME